MKDKCFIYVYTYSVMIMMMVNAMLIVSSITHMTVVSMVMMLRSLLVMMMSMVVMKMTTTRIIRNVRPHNYNTTYCMSAYIYKYVQRLYYACRTYVHIPCTRNDAV